MRRQNAYPDIDRLDISRRGAAAVRHLKALVGTPLANIRLTARGGQDSGDHVARGYTLGDGRYATIERWETSEAAPARITVALSWEIGGDGQIYDQSRPIGIYTFVPGSDTITCLQYDDKGNAGRHWLNITVREEDVDRLTRFVSEVTARCLGDEC